MIIYHLLLEIIVLHAKFFKQHFQGCSPWGICLGSRWPRGSFFSWLGLASASHGLNLTASASALPHSFCLGLEGSALPRLGSISQLKRASAHGAQVQRYAQRLCLLLEMNNEELFLTVCFWKYENHVKIVLIIFLGMALSEGSGVVKFRKSKFWCSFFTINM